MAEEGGECWGRSRCAAEEAGDMGVLCVCRVCGRKRRLAEAEIAAAAVAAAAVAAAAWQRCWD